MPTQISQYKCPCCTAPLRFDGKADRLECDYCGSSYTVAEMEAMYTQQDAQAEKAFAEAEAAAEQEAVQQQEETAWDASGLSQDWGADGEKLRMLHCPSCGAELITDDTTAATSCPYCGNNTIVPGQFQGALKPDYVLPFKLSKEDARAALKNHYKKKHFLPKEFSAQNHLEEIKGIYVPFWLFESGADADCTFHATRSHCHREGEYDVTVTEHFRVRRGGSMEFEHVPTDASQKMPDDYMDSLEPYDYSDLKPFSVGYLPGYLADKYDVPPEDCMTRADQRCRATAIEQMRRDVVGYDTVVTTGSNVSLQRGKIHYALMPVWTLHTKWQGKDYLFMMNGQTGKMVGDLPVSQGKYWGTFAALTGVFTVAMTVLGVGKWIAMLFMG